MVMAQSLFITLKQHISGACIDVLAPAWSIPLLERMPEVNQALVMPLGHGQFDLVSRFKLGKQLRSAVYQQVIVLPNSWKSALIPFFAGIPRRTGYRGELRWGLLNDIRVLDKSQLPMTVQRFVALGLESDSAVVPVYPFPKLAIEPERQRLVCEKFQLTTAKKILALCPGAEYGSAKRWPVTHFAEVARQMHKLGWDVWLIGSEKDSSIAGQIADLAGGACVNFAGRTSLGEAVDLLSFAQLVVSNDSGLMHVAAALDKPVIAIYGSSDPSFTPPLHDQSMIVDLYLDCSPCFKRECPLGHTQCLTEISPATILAAIAEKSGSL